MKDKKNSSYPLPRPNHEDKPIENKDNKSNTGSNKAFDGYPLKRSTPNRAGEPKEPNPPSKAPKVPRKK